MGCQPPEVGRLLGDRTDQSVDGLVGQRHHFRVGSVLDRMFHEDPLRLKAERIPLNVGRVDEHVAGHENGGDAAPFEINGVVHTARRATASIG